MLLNHGSCALTDALQDAEESKAAAEGSEGGQKNEADALMEMGKLNTARIRKAVDPRILEVKKRVRQVRCQHAGVGRWLVQHHAPVSSTREVDSGGPGCGNLWCCNVPVVPAHW